LRRRCRHGHLLADDGLHVAVEREQERLDVAADEIARRMSSSPWGLSGNVPSGMVKPRNGREAHATHEAEHGVEATIMEEPEAADLISLVVVVAGENAEPEAAIPNMPIF
jgi:hypothetical protein